MSCRRATIWVIAFCFAVAARAAAQEDEEGITVGQVPPPAAVQTLDGATVDLKRVIGLKPALIEFWATWCPRCRALEPRLNDAAARYRGKVQFLAVAVAVNETLASVRRHLALHPASYPFVWDADGAAVRAFQAPTTSYMVLLGRDGKVFYTGVGAEQDFEPALAKIAAAP
ncbi:MAG TPA: TlpA disulfide reductase family protein [Gemmatimonadales bacterium]|nr:TlpA disulfide reductase family protein [Gemmatimonadales bacterium]